MKPPILPMRQRGVVLFITLIALVILLISSIALLRSTDTALLISGNLAVKRDMTNQAESAIAAAVAQFTAGGLATEGARAADSTSANYSATVLPSNSQGVPNVLFATDSTFAGSYSAAQPAATNGLSYRYVIDRMCPTAGAPSSSNRCGKGSTIAEVGGNARASLLNGGRGSPTRPGPVIYRISVRVTDARQTQSFVQTTLRISGKAPFGTP